MKHALLLSFFIMSGPAQAAWLHLCPAATPSSTAAQASLHAEVADTPAPPGCRGVALAAGTAQVEAVYALGPDEVPGSAILLQGPAGAGRFAPASHSLPAPGPAPAGRAPMPLHTDLLAMALVRPFGLEERVRVERGPDGLRLTCDAGTRPAGLLVSGSWYLPRASSRLRARFSGHGAFRLQSADAHDAARERARDLGVLDAAAAERSVAMTLPADTDRANWRQFVIVCPPHPATLVLASLALELAPVPGAARGRATWIWDSSQWQAGGDALLDWARAEGMAELYIVVPLRDDAVRDPALLAAFIRRAHAAGIAVSSVDGDPHMVLPRQHGATVRRARAYAAYNDRAAAPERLRAIQFDIEPYLLPPGLLAPPEAERQYLALARALRHAAGATALEFVVPYWWSDKSALLSSLASFADGLAVMDYRTAPDEIIRFAAPFLDWAAQHGKRVRIALEAGAVAPEIQRRYVRAAAGQPGSLVLAQAGGRPVLVLLRDPVAAADAPLFRLEEERLFDGGATSFHAQKERLADLLPRLERDFSAWQGFAGLALHGWR